MNYENVYINRAIEAKRNVTKLDKIVKDAFVAASANDFDELLYYLQSNGLLVKIYAKYGL